MKLLHETVKLSTIIKFFVENYKFNEGESLFRYESCVDTAQDKVKLDLFINEKDDAK